MMTVKGASANRMVAKRTSLWQDKVNKYIWPIPLFPNIAVWDNDREPYVKFYDSWSSTEPVTTALNVGIRWLEAHLTTEEWAEYVTERLLE